MGGGVSNTIVTEAGLRLAPASNLERGWRLRLFTILFPFQDHLPDLLASQVETEKLEGD